MESVVYVVLFVLVLLVSELVALPEIARINKGDRLLCPHRTSVVRALDIGRGQSGLSPLLIRAISDALH